MAHRSAFVMAGSVAFCAAQGCSNVGTVSTDATVHATADAVVTSDVVAPTDASAAAVLRNGNTGALADYSCLGHFTPGAPGSTAPQVFHVGALRVPTVPDTHIELIDPTTGAPTGVSADADASGNAMLAVPANTLLAWHATIAVGCPDTCVDTWQFAGLTLSTAAALAGGVNPITLFDIDDYVGFYSDNGVDQSSTGGELVGTVLDCAGAPVSGASIVGFGAAGAPIPVCDRNNLVSGPCVRYYGDLPITRLGDPSFTATGVNGLFMVFSAPAEAFTITAVGVLDPTVGRVTTVASLAAMGFTRAVTYGNVFPLAR